MKTTFAEWDDIHARVLFTWWDISSPIYYIATWIIIFTMAVGYQASRAFVCGIEDKLSKPTCSRASLKWVASLLVYIPDNATLFLRIFHAVCHAFSFAMGLLLMLIAMTFNVGLFIALVAGFWTGDMLCEVLHEDGDTLD